MSPPRSVIPPDLAVALTRVGERLARGASIDRDLDLVLTGLGRLPPAAVARADGEVARLANLSWYFQAGHDGPMMRWLSSQAQTDLTRLGERPALAPLFLFHRNGFVREGALDRITTLPPSAFFFAVLGLRLNDWVEPVRRAAGRCIQRVAPSAPPEVAADGVLFLLGRQTQWLRWSDSQDVLDALLDRPEVAEILIARIASATAGPFAHVLRQALRNPGLDVHLAPLSRTALQPAVRAVALQTLLTRQASWSAGFEHQWIDRRFGQGRRVATLAHRTIETTCSLPDLLRAGLTDPAALVRRVAADALSRDPAAFPDLDWAIARLGADPNRANRERGDYLRRCRDASH